MTRDTHMKASIALGLCIAITLAPHAAAQNVNCTVSCTIVSDPAPVGSNVTLCRLFQSGTLVVSGPLVGNACSFSRTIANGVTVTYTARFANATEESADSAPLTITSTAPSPPGGLIAGLAFNETSGTSAADTTSNGHTGTLVNGPVFVAGKYGNALSFDGSNDSVTVGNPATINLAADFTIAVWVKRNALGGSQRHILGKCGASWASGCKELYFNSSNVLNFGSQGTGNTTAGTIADTNWHHVAATFTRSTNTVVVYVDGVQRTSAVRNLEADGSGHVVTVGNMHGANPFSGLIDELRIYDQALTAAQIATAMGAPLSPPLPTPSNLRIGP